MQSDLFCQVADIALRVGKPLRWDPATERFENSDEANARLIEATAVRADRIVDGA